MVDDMLTLKNFFKKSANFCQLQNYKITTTTRTKKVIKRLQKLLFSMINIITEKLLLSKTTFSDFHLAYASLLN